MAEILTKHIQHIDLVMTLKDSGVGELRFDVDGNVDNTRTPP
jgi:hypothetical protein